MSPAFSLRPYQHETRDAVLSAIDGGMRRPAAVLPTGTGKSVILADVAGHLWQRGRASGRERGIIVAHREELVGQNAAKLRQMNPELSVGEVIGDTNEVGRCLLSASIQTLATHRRREQITDVGFIIIDEAHHAVANTYRKVLGHFGALEDLGVPAFDGRGQIPAFGLTATMVRSDKSALGDIWDDVVYTRSVGDMVAGGYLVRPRGKIVRVGDLDLTKVRTIGGDFSDGQLGDAIEHSAAPQLIARAYRDHAAERPGIVFAPTVHSAGIIRDALAAESFKAEVIHGGLAKGERRAMLQRFRDRDTQILVNCAILTEGTDLPLASCVVIARPTQSLGLYIQMVGRVLRPDEGKADALILDVVGVSKRHALVSPVDLFGEEVMEREKRDPDDDDDDSDNEVIELEDDPFGEQLVMDKRGLWTGAYSVEEVDLFHSSAAMWQQTRAGWWFIRLRTRLLAVIPSEYPGMWDVIAMHPTDAGQSQWVFRNAERMQYAQAYAEGALSSAERWEAQGDAGWRHAPATRAQHMDAQVMGARIPRGASRGEAQSAIDVAAASLRIDAPVQKLIESRRGVRA